MRSGVVGLSFLYLTLNDAKFDPKKASSSNLLASVGGLSLLATDKDKED